MFRRRNKMFGRYSGHMGGNVQAARNRGVVGLLAVSSLLGGLLQFATPLDLALGAPNSAKALALEPVTGEAPPILSTFEAQDPFGIALTTQHLWFGGANQVAKRLDLRTGKIENLPFGRGASFFSANGNLWLLREGASRNAPWRISQLDPVSASPAREGRVCRGEMPWGPSIAVDAGYIAIACGYGPSDTDCVTCNRVDILDSATLENVKSLTPWTLPYLLDEQISLRDGVMWLSAAQEQRGWKIQRWTIRYQLTEQQGSQPTKVPCLQADRYPDYGGSSGFAHEANGLLWCSSGGTVQAYDWATERIVSELEIVTTVQSSAVVDGHLVILGRDGASSDNWRLAVVNLASGQLVWKSAISVDKRRHGWPTSIALQGAELWVASEKAVSKYDVSGVPGFEANDIDGNPPGAVQDLTADPLPGQILVTWNEPHPIPSVRINHYQYRLGDGPWQITDKRRLVVTRGADRGAVKITVRARTISTHGPESSVSQAPLAARRPATIRAIDAREANCGADFRWTPPRHSGEAALTGYEYYFTIESPNSPWRTWTSPQYTARVGQPFARFRDCVSRGKELGISVRAINSAGLKSAWLFDSVDVSRRPPKPDPEPWEPECPLYLYYMDQAGQALAEGDVYNYLRYLQLAREIGC